MSINKNRPVGWNERQNKLKLFSDNQKKWTSLICKEETFAEGKNLLLKNHSLVHDKKVYKTDDDTIYDLLWDNLTVETCKIIPKKGASILWCIWHTTRIEDLISNLLIGNNETVFNKEIQTKLNIKISDVGNSMTNSEIDLLNNNINIKALKEYRIKVGKSTKKILESLEFNDLKIKVKPEQIKKITQNGGVLNDPNSIWLLDYWGNKNILGLLKVPITSHHTNYHFIPCFAIKDKHCRIGSLI
ncbi:MAG: hypothetical protein FWD87_07890 [Spirochaetaceae bacterium]|nr:hypothetical protein [Spirochaetaceae bacterium]